MPELRKDPIVGRWVIIAHERAKRPHDFKSDVLQQVEGGLCPFCEGQEHDTPGEVFSVREPGSVPNGPGWSLRVVPNKYPAVLLPSPVCGEGSRTSHTLRRRASLRLRRVGGCLRTQPRNACSSRASRSDSTVGYWRARVRSSILARSLAARGTRGACRLGSGAAGRRGSGGGFQRRSW